MRGNKTVVALLTAVALLPAAPVAQNTGRADRAGQSPAASPPQPETQATEARIARVERGLLPGILIAGKPVAPATIADRMAALHVPGASIAFIDNGAIAWARGYGVLEAGSDAPVTPATLFQAASISKPVAALAAMRLVEQGRLALDDDVNARLRSWKVPENELTATEKVTLRRLLSHTAGLTVSGFPGYEAGTPVPSVVQVLDGGKPANTGPIRVDVQPGTVWRYSGGGFTVMQLLLTDVTGRPFPDLLSELVLKPAGMSASTYDQPLPASRQKEAATAHDNQGRPIPGRSHTYPEMAAAGLWTTPSDLARFVIEMQKALRGESTLITAETARLMTTVEKQGYGLGLQVQGIGAGRTFGHGGSNAGFRCSMVGFFDRPQGVVIMTNGDRGGWLMSEIQRAVSNEYGWPRFKPVERKTVEVAPEKLAALTGRYLVSLSHALDVVLEGSTLFIVDGAQRIELHPESETRFFELAEEHTIEFVKGGDGVVPHLLIDGQAKAPKVPGKQN